MNTRRWTLLLLCLLMLALPALALCEEKVRLTMIYWDTDQPISGAQFDLYRLADMDEDGKLTVVSPFTRYNVRIDSLEQSYSVAKTLESYILRDQLTPMKSIITDENGGAELVWDRDAFKPGLFLMIAKAHNQDGYVYRVLPVTFLLPYVDPQTGEWRCDLRLDPKVEKEPGEQEPQEIMRKAMKVWSPHGGEIEHPKQVEVQLLRDGVIADTQILSEENDWVYVWENLSDEHEWVVTETEMSGYNVVIEKFGVTFRITNTRDESIVLPTPTPTLEPGVTPTPTPTLEPGVTPTPTPTLEPGVTPTPTPTLEPGVTPTPTPTLEPGVTPTPTPTLEPGVTPTPTPTLEPGVTPTPTPTLEPGITPTVIPTVSPTPTPKPTPTKTPRPTPTMNPNVLPQTGQLWWPVPVLMASGVLLVVLGLIRRRGDSDEE